MAIFKTRKTSKSFLSSYHDEQWAKFWRIWNSTRTKSLFYRLALPENQYSFRKLMVFQHVYMYLLLLTMTLLYKFQYDSQKKKKKKHKSVSLQLHCKEQWLQLCKVNKCKVLNVCHTACMKRSKFIEQRFYKIRIHKILNR